MSAVDVQTETWIARPVADVYGYASNPDNAPQWYVNIKSVEWKSAPPVAVGSRMAFVAEFMGKRLEYTYEVVEMEIDARFVMRTAEGPFPMETTYAFSAEKDGTTMTLRNRGKPTGFSALMTPFMKRAMRRANQKDLAMLKGILERAT